MKLNYTVKAMKIKSEWFDEMGRKKNVYQKITYKGLFLYFQLYKFRLHNQENEHTFMTSISMLRKETGYTSNEVFDLLKKLKAAKVINLENVSRWEYLLDIDKNVRDKDILMITATDAYSLTDYERKEDEGFYIYIPLDLFTKYEKAGLNEKYYALYCLIKKWSNNPEDKMWMSISKMANRLGFDKDYVNQMIYTLNRNYFLSSYRKKRKGEQGFNFEHYILDNGKSDKIEKFVSEHKANMDKLIKRVDKKKKSKKSTNIEDEMEIIEVTDENDKLAFGKRNGETINLKRQLIADNELDEIEKLFG
ncbi:hypothetical protein [Peribacillus frigoritolerans]|uniref:hypothetical protein n=1 Tax=Peribacillus frigoritolerans TaxID=450367 RepID=UPI00227E17D9|nr:hypothetical protein [Peribacillus frigoritolerans]MCY9007167.1 hypothetical protein [Peribacillus frigoritolerans]